MQILIDPEKLLDWIRGFGEAGHFINEEACSDFSNQVQSFLETEPQTSEGKQELGVELPLLEQVRKNLIRVQDLEGHMKLQDGVFEVLFHQAMIAYAAAMAAFEDDPELDEKIILDHAFSEFCLAPRDAAERVSMEDCMMAYYQLIRA
jgi:hypothetical protein